MRNFVEGLTSKGQSLRVADSHTGNHPEDDFTPLETIRRSNSNWEEDSIRARKGGLRAGEEEMSFRNFVYAEDEEDLTFFPRSLLLASPAKVMIDSGGSPKPELFVVHHGSVDARMKNRKCKTRGGTSRPHVKRKLASRSSTFRATRAKTSTSKDDVPFLTVSDDDEGLYDVPELKDSTACHLKIFAITPPT
ncbi:hypothetical protein Tco_1176465 [Tanacetum coccineum]